MKVSRKKSSNKLQHLAGNRPLIYALSADESPELVQKIKENDFEDLIHQLKLNWVKQIFELLSQRKQNQQKFASIQRHYSSAKPERCRTPRNLTVNKSAPFCSQSRKVLTPKIGRNSSQFRTPLNNNHRSPREFPSAHRF